MGSNIADIPTTVLKLPGDHKGPCGQHTVAAL